ncbi:MAG: UbiD family decarboxylase [Phycisphaerales bacterium]|nr:UbiD family decarboxylase [Phycisphaerales bacterium]
MAARCHTLADFLERLERDGELRRVAASISPLLEPAAQAVSESSQLVRRPSKEALSFDPFGASLGGQAIRFDQVEGSDFPLVMNVFGSWSRMEAALGEPVEALAGRIEAITHLTPPAGFRDAVQRIRQVLPMLRAAPRRVSRGVCQEVVRLTDQGEVDLRRLPMIKCWPFDGDPQAVGWPLSAEASGTAKGQGRYITLAGMHTIHARDRHAKRPASHNIGMYRAQLVDSTHLAMHWHLHHDGAAHWRSWKEIGEPMPICICLGGEPVLPWAATAPLPPGISELLMAGFVHGRGIPMVEAKTVPLRVPANSEIVIEGWVHTEAGGPGWDPASGEPIGPGAVLEGPFGDHTGYYSLPDRYPIVDVTAITHRREAVFPATVVGPPPQEDYWLGKTTERVFLPLLKTLIPDLEDYDLPTPGCFHNWAVVGIRKSYPYQARRIMHAVWGAGQMAWTKCVMVVDADQVDVHDLDQVLRAVFTHVDFGRDLECAYGPLDILDHAATHLAAGGKIGFDATPRMDGEQAGTQSIVPPSKPSADDVSTLLDSLDHQPPFDVPDWGCHRCVVIGSDKATPEALLDASGSWTGLVLLMDSTVDVGNRDQVWFHVLAGIDPARDLCRRNGRAVIDARAKQPDASMPGPVRPWPPFLGWSVRGQ